MKYEEPAAYTREQIEHMSHSNDPQTLCKMLIGLAFNEKDLMFAYSVVCKYLKHQDLQVASLAIICLAHLARIHGEIPEQQTIESLRNIIKSERGKDSKIKGRIGDVVGDLSVYQPTIYAALIKEFPNYFAELGFEI